MKLEIIAALIHKPKVIFLDEPTIGLDMISQKKIRNFLKYYNQEYKATILLTSHYMKDIEDLCSRIIVINEGVIVYDGKGEGINSIYDNKKVITLKFSSIVDKEMLEQFGDIRKYDECEAEIEVNKDEIKILLQRAMDILPVSDFSISDISLEEGLERMYAR